MHRIGCAGGGRKEVAAAKNLSTLLEMTLSELDWGWMHRIGWGRDGEEATAAKNLIAD
jgi:hypothetical protein